MGVTRTLLKLRQKFYWVGFKQNIITWCKTCKICDSYKLGHVPKRAPLQQKPIGNVRERIACDIMGPLKTNSNGNSYICVIGDYFTKFVEAYPIPDQTAQTVADCLVTKWICTFGVPLTIHTDQG